MKVIVSHHLLVHEMIVEILGEQDMSRMYTKDSRVEKMNRGPDLL